MGELNEWGKAISNLIKSGGTTTSSKSDSKSESNKDDNKDDDSTYDYRDAHGCDPPKDDDD